MTSVTTAMDRLEATYLKQCLTQTHLAGCQQLADQVLGQRLDLGKQSLEYGCAFDALDKKYPPVRHARGGHQGRDQAQAQIGQGGTRRVSVHIASVGVERKTQESAGATGVAGTRIRYLPYDRSIHRLHLFVATHSCCEMQH